MDTKPALGAYHTFEKTWVVNKVSDKALIWNEGHFLSEKYQDHIPIVTVLDTKKCTVTV